MGFNSSSGQTTANVTGGLTIATLPASSTGRVTRNSAGTSDMGTVGAGKIWYVMTVTLSAGTHTSNDVTEAEVRAAGTCICNLRTICNATGVANNSISANWSMSGAPKLIAGEKIQLVTDSTLVNSATVTYVEVDA
jgi:hypothetical protein